MTIQVQCHNCEKAYRLKDELQGKKFRCKGCGEVVVATPMKTKSTTAPQEEPKPKKRKPSPVEPEPDPFADDFGDLEGYEDLPAPALPTKRKKKKKSSKKPKQTASSGSFSDRIPNMTFNLHRINAALVIGGGIVMFFAFQEFGLASKSNSVPVEITLSELVEKGPQDNVYFTVRDFMPAGDDYVYEESRPGNMTKVWVPCIPLDTQDTTKFILYSNNTRTEDALIEMVAADTVTGMIVNDITKLDRETTNLLKQGLPGVDISAAYIFEANRKPSSYLACTGLFLIGLILILGGLFWIFFIHQDFS